MKKSFILKKLPLVILISGLALTISFAQTNTGTKNETGKDTIPTKNKQIRDLDEALLDLEKGEME